MVNLLFDGKQEDAVSAEAERVASGLAGPAGKEPGVEVRGPAPQPISRLKGKHRWHLTLRGPDHRVLRSLAESALLAHAGRRSRVRLSVDVDPVSLL
jgi:primosomal protein N' (replication factor Y)